MVNHASMALMFWDEAIFSCIFLINSHPSTIFNECSPLEVLFRIKPDYHFLKVFGCLCSLDHTLLTNQKCHAIDGRLFLSRDVILYENCFPFQSLSFVSNLGPQTHNFQSVKIVLPLLITIPHKLLILFLWMSLLFPLVPNISINILSYLHLIFLYLPSFIHKFVVIFLTILFLFPLYD